MKPLLNTLQDIILDNQETALFTGVRRHVQLGALPDKALVCIGVRRCGKSTALHQVMRRLLDGGVDPRNLLYVNFFDDRLHALNRGNIGLVEEAYFLLYPEKKRTERIYCFFDEIQVVEGWEPFVDRMRRSGKCEIYITG